jgi:hypothetical protein
MKGSKELTRSVERDFAALFKSSADFTVVEVSMVFICIEYQRLCTVKRTNSYELVQLFALSSTTLGVVHSNAGKLFDPHLPKHLPTSSTAKCSPQLPPETPRRN